MEQQQQQQQRPLSLQQLMQLTEHFMGQTCLQESEE